MITQTTSGYETFGFWATQAVIAAFRAALLEEAAEEQGDLSAVGAGTLTTATNNQTATKGRSR